MKFRHGFILERGGWFFHACSQGPNLFRTFRLRQEFQGLLNCSVDVVRLRTRMNPTLRASIEREARYF